MIGFKFHQLLILGLGLGTLSNAASLPPRGINLASNVTLASKVFVDFPALILRVKNAPPPPSDIDTTQIWSPDHYNLLESPFWAVTQVEGSDDPIFVHRSQYASQPRSSGNPTQDKFTRKRQSGEPNQFDANLYAHDCPSVSITIEEHSCVNYNHSIDQSSFSFFAGVGPDASFQACYRLSDGVPCGQYRVCAVSTSGSSGQPTLCVNPPNNADSVELNYTTH